MQQVALARFTVVDSSSQEAIARLGDADLDVDDVDDGGRVIAECDQSALATASLDDFPMLLCFGYTQRGRFWHVPFGTFDKRAAEVRKSEICREEIRVNEVCMGEICAGEFRLPKIGTGEVCLAEDGRHLGVAFPPRIPNHGPLPQQGEMFFLYHLLRSTSNSGICVLPRHRAAYQRS
jgi:hypothetical protein